MSNTGQAIHGIERLVNPGMDPEAKPYWRQDTIPPGYVETGFWPGPLVYQRMRREPAECGGVGKGTLGRWAETFPEYRECYFVNLVSDYRAGPPSVIWWQIAVHNTEHSGTFTTQHQQWILDMVAWIDATWAGVPLFISPVNLYEPGHTCDALGDDGVQVSLDAAAWAIANTRGSVGPIMAALDDSTRRDSCHATDDFTTVWGAQLLTFFIP